MKISYRNLKLQSLWAVSFFLLTVFLFPGLVESAPVYPNRPIEMIVGFGAGGAAGVTARLVAGYVSKKSGRLSRPKGILGIHARGV